MKNNNNSDKENNITQPNSSNTEEAPTDKEIYINDTNTGALICLSHNKDDAQKSETITEA